MVARTLLEACFLFLYAAAFALVEIEIEGPHGWAEKLPTWYRISPWYARLFATLMRGKPLTGYHATMIPLALMSFHVGLAFGQPFTLALEARIVATFLFWTILWDFLWFLWNPAFGWQRFRPGRVWWLSRRWLLRMPLEYWSALLSSLFLAALPWLLADDHQTLRSHLTVVLALLLLVLVVAVPLIPAYHRWYRHMRRPGSDERHRVLAGGENEPSING